MSTVAFTVVLLLDAATMYLFARMLGFGRCHTCGALNLPWNTHCWAHTPQHDDPEGPR